MGGYCSRWRQGIRTTKTSHPLCRSPNPGKNVREAVCVGDQEEGTLENEKGCALENGRGNCREGFDLL